MDQLFRVDRDEATMCVLDFSDSPKYPIGFTIAQRGALIGNGIALNREEALALASKLDEATGGFQCERCPLADPGDCLHYGHCRHRDGPKPVWRCFFCDEVFNDAHAAAQHFGMDETKTPACKINGSEHGLIKALRDAEAEADEAIQRMHSESTDAAKAYHRQRTRHAQALIAAEEVGYARGMRDVGAGAHAQRGRSLFEALEWFSGQHRLSLQHYAPMYGDDDDQSVEWRVLRESGPINDREWEIVGRGDTAPDAILAAFNQGGGSDER